MSIVKIHNDHLKLRLTSLTININLLTMLLTYFFILLDSNNPDKHQIDYVLFHNMPNKFSFIDDQFRSLQGVYLSLNQIEFHFQIILKDNVG